MGIIQVEYLRRLTMRKQALSVTIEPDVLDAIKILAKADDRSISQFINYILKQYIKKETINDATK
jgi:hypothetical protein